MTSTQVTFKPGGVIALVAVCAVVATAGISRLRARTATETPDTAVSATIATPVAEIAPEPPVSGPELAEMEFLAGLNATPGQKRDWLFLGPLPSGSNITNVENTKDDEATMRRIIGTSYLPTEAKYKAQADVPVTVGGKTYHWRKVSGSAFDFKNMYASKETPRSGLVNTVVYGYTSIDSKGNTRKRLRFRSDDGAIVWVNGKQVYFGDDIRGVEKEDVVPFDLRDGRNNVLVKIGQGNGGWGMSFHVEDFSKK